MTRWDCGTPPEGFDGDGFGVDVCIPLAASYGDGDAGHLRTFSELVNDYHHGDGFGSNAAASLPWSDLIHETTSERNDENGSEKP